MESARLCTFGKGHLDVGAKMRQIVALIGALALASSLWFPQESRAQIPASFFGIHSSHAGFPVKVKYGNFRNLGSGLAWWHINTCNPPHSPADCRSNPAANSSFNFDGLDAILAQVKAAGANDVLFTLAYTPEWAAASVPPKGTCAIPRSGCILPPDINSDGSGANAVWDNWVENIAARVNNPTWLKTHAHIKYWEPWNEVFSDLTISGCCSPQSSTGTYAQHLRLTEDTRCLTGGTGTIHNYPSAGSSTTCASYLSAHGYSAIDPSAQIVLSSQAPGDARSGWIRFFQNYFYCSNNPKKDLGSTTSCTWSGGLNWMSAAVDILNFHLYTDEEQPEADLPIGSANNWVGAIKGVLSAADRTKPLWNGEGSCGTPPSRNPKHIWGDSYSMAGYVPRYAALLWSAGVTASFWFMYDTTEVPFCPLWDGRSLTPAGVAWNTTYNWLVGAAPVNTPFCSNAGTTWTCPLIEANGKPAELVWDSQYGTGGRTAPANCASAANPLICGSTAFTVPAAYSAGWIDVGGTSHPHTSTVTIGAVPILLEGSSSPSVKGKAKPTGHMPM
jgi:hypothetical protein